ncbi:hypothetical protein [Corynebacterium sp. HS2168-gen11]|uniref:hypothetical protein n=1 Tax=Corynebacterium sp. HS2168-gen11 TaxID=2974027 RepID=UPI00216B2737|nr:hypothetical protein [Corynebacterium sp. HS2168-gen11]MCS4535430.1 hypothetical protein [Corynebacterium sp. HS2168-gen11]
MEDTAFYAIVTIKDLPCRYRQRVETLFVETLPTLPQATLDLAATIQWQRGSRGGLTSCRQMIVGIVPELHECAAQLTHMCSRLGVAGELVLLQPVEKLLHA